MIATVWSNTANAITTRRLKPIVPQSRPDVVARDVVARAAAMRECGQLLAVATIRLRVARRDFGRPRGGDIAVQLGELIFRLGREDDAGIHTLPACSAASRARTLCAVTAREGSATTASYAAAPRHEARLQ